MTQKTEKAEKTKTKGLRKLEEMRKQIDPEKANFEEVRNNITEYGMRIVMDEEKILKEDIYDLEKLYKAIDDIAIYSEMKKINKYYYVSMNNSWVDLGVFAFNNLEEKEWFIDNVKEWLWLDKLEGITDILEYIEKRNKKKKINEKVS